MSKNHDMSGNNSEKYSKTDSLEVQLPNQFRIPEAPSSEDTWVDDDRYGSFSEWIESEVTKLESLFESFVTPNSTKRFFGR